MTALVLRRSARPLIAALLVTTAAARAPVPAVQPKPTARPARIVSLVPAVTEMLFALGAGDRVAAVSNFDRFPPEVERLPRVGALLDPDVERILSLEPDLVIVYRSQDALMKQLARASIPVYVYAHAGLPDLMRTIREVGDRIGASREAAQLTGRMEAAIGAVRAAAEGRPRPRTLVVFGREAFTLRGIYASGGVGFVHDMLSAAGGDNVFADVKREAVQASTELIIARKPEVILELRADPIAPDVEARELRTWTALSSVPAVSAGRVTIIADPRTVIPGPRVAEGMQLLARALHGARR
jgi:iron complex transport system substrate-binding protein